MSTLQPLPSQPRRNRRPPDTSGKRDTAIDWERDWRWGVNDSIAALTESQQKTALILEQVMNRLTVVEQRPVRERAWLNTSNQSRATLIAMGGFLFAVITYALQHVSFH